MILQILKLSKHFMQYELTYVYLSNINSCLNYPEYCIDIFSPDNDVIWGAAVQRPLTVQSVLSIGLSAQPVRSTILTLGLLLLI